MFLTRLKQILAHGMWSVDSVDSVDSVLNRFQRICHVHLDLTANLLPCLQSKFESFKP